MYRRVVALVATSALLGVPPSHGDTPPPPQLPMATCDARIADGPGDGIATYNVVAAVDDPPVNDPRGNLDALDIRSITFRVTPTRVLAFLTVADLPETFRDTDSAYSYILWFKLGGKYARFEQVYANPAHVQQGLTADSSSKASTATNTNGGAALAGTASGVDKGKNIVYVSADRSALEADLGGPLANGDELTEIGGRTELWLPKQPTPRPADKAEDVAPDKAVWKVGNDGCFAPSTFAVPGVTAQYGDRATLTATLKDDAGVALATRKVTFTVPGESAPRTMTTDAAGKVALVLNAAPPAGTYQVKVSYAGDEFSGGGQGSGTLTVRAETIRMAKLAVKKSGTTRTVTATLTEDDPRAFGKQPVAWYVNGKKVATVSTDSAGRSVFKGAKAGQKVQARYAGVTGRYLAVSSNTVTA